MRSESVVERSVLHLVHLDARVATFVECMAKK